MDTAWWIGIAVTLTVALLPVVLSWWPRVRRGLFNSESPARRAYWQARLSERLEHTRVPLSEPTASRVQRRVEVALNHVEADETLQRIPQPGAWLSWLLLAEMMLAGLLVGVVQPFGPAASSIIAIILILAGFALELDALARSASRKELRSVLIHLITHYPVMQKWVESAPDDVVTAWKKVRYEGGAEPRRSKVRGALRLFGRWVGVLDLPVADLSERVMDQLLPPPPPHPPQTTVTSDEGE